MPRHEWFTSDNTFVWQYITCQCSFSVEPPRLGIRETVLSPHNKWESRGHKFTLSHLLSPPYSSTEALKGRRRIKTVTLTGHVDISTAHVGAGHMALSCVSSTVLCSVKPGTGIQLALAHSLCQYG